MRVRGLTGGYNRSARNRVALTWRLVALPRAKPPPRVVRQMQVFTSQNLELGMCGACRVAKAFQALEGTRAESPYSFNPDERRFFLHGASSDVVFV